MVEERHSDDGHDVDPFKLICSTLRYVYSSARPIMCLHLFASFYKNIWQLYMYVYTCANTPDDVMLVRPLVLNMQGKRIFH
ncbi:hypothetical protein FLHKCMKP_CDS0077 [Escherichia phage KS_A3]